MGNDCFGSNTAQFVGRTAASAAIYTGVNMGIHEGVNYVRKR